MGGAVSAMVALSELERYFLPRGGRGFSPSSRARNPGKKIAYGSCTER